MTARSPWPSKTATRRNSSPNFPISPSLASFGKKVTLLEPMDSDEKTLSLALAAHPGWMSEDFLKAVTGIATAPLALLLEDLAKQGKILRGEDERPYWRIADP